MSQTRSALHIFNTHVEFEMDSPNTLSLEEGLLQHPTFLQLQFLPFLFANVSDSIALLGKCEESFYKNLQSQGWLQNDNQIPHRVYLNEVLNGKNDFVNSWGWSQQVKNWCDAFHIHYDMPAWDCVKKVNSKAFSFLESASLPGSALLSNEKEFALWLQYLTDEGVFKTCFGVSGRGNRRISKFKNKPLEPVLAFCQNEWDKGLPIIAEPWVERVLDFSTQWTLQKNGTQEFVGLTIMQNSPAGTYEGTVAGVDAQACGPYQDLYEEHLSEARKILNKMHQEGFWGPVGLDCMLYRSTEDREKVLLKHIVEANARCTMSRVALQIQHERFPEKGLIMRYIKTIQGREGLLPNRLFLKNDRVINFPKQLYFDFIDKRHECYFF